MVIDKRTGRVLSENRSQYLGSVILIIFGCLLFTCMALVGSNMQRLISEFAALNVQEDASFTTDKSISDLGSLESEANAVIEEGKSVDCTLSEGKTLRIFALNDKVDRPAIVEGKNLSGSGEILLNPTFAEAQNYKIGDTITISNKSYRIAGFMALPHYIYPLRTETEIMYSPQNFGIAVISRDDFVAFDKVSSFYAVKFNLHDQNPRVKAAQFRELVRSKGANILQWSNIADNKRVGSAVMKIEAIAAMSKAVPIMILFLTSILIGNVMGRLIKRESPIIGALYALGYRRKEIYRHYLIYPLVISVLGGILGTGIGLLSVRPMVLFLLTAFTIPLNGINFDPAIIAASVLLPVLFLGCGALLAMRKELKHSPVELMKGDKEKNKVNFMERALRLDRLNFKAKFQLREQLRSLSRLAFLLVGCALAAMLMLYGFTIRSSLDKLLNGSMTSTFKFQYEYMYKELHYEQPPAGTEPFSASLFLPQSGEGRDFYISGVMSNSSLLTFFDKSGSPLNTDQVIITKPLADRLNVRPGDTIQVMRKIDERLFSLKIDSIADSYVGKYIFMPLEVYNEKFGMPEGSFLGLWSKGKLDIPQDKLYSTKSIDESVSAFEASTAPIQTMVYMYSIVAFIMGMIVIYLVTSMIVEENKHSISLLKIFGYRRKEVNSLILNSSAIVVVIGYILGIPLILTSIGVLLKSLDESVGLTMPLSINPVYVIIGFLVVMLSYELSKAMCRKKVSAVSMSEALKSGME